MVKDRKASCLNKLLGGIEMLMRDDLAQNSIPVAPESENIVSNIRYINKGVNQAIEMVSSVLNTVKSV